MFEAVAVCEATEVDVRELVVEDAPMLNRLAEANTNAKAAAATAGTAGAGRHGPEFLTELVTTSSRFS